MSRALVNQDLARKDILLSGRILDLGAGGGKASYHRFLKLAEGAKLLRLDINKASQPDRQLNLEKDFLPEPANSVDTILAFNLFEHIFNFEFLASEVFRVLKPGGKLIGSVPFFIRVHPDPQDFFRYTKSALQKIFQQAGFKQIEIKFIGRGPFLACLYQVDFIFAKRFFLCLAFRFLLVYLVLFLDKIILSVKPSLKQRYPLDFLFFVDK